MGSISHNFNSDTCMPCDHKFKEYLDLDKLDFEPTTLVVGTFNPAWPASNNAEWFYGRTDESYFWHVLPRLYGTESLLDKRATEWKLFCKEHKIALTDLICCVEDANEGNKAHSKILGGYSDKALVYNFDDHEYVNIVNLLKRYPSIKQVYITRGVTEAFWRHAWNPVMRYCNANEIRERKLVTPSDEVIYHYNTYNNEHAGEEIPDIKDYILMRWREEWHF